MATPATSFSNEMAQLTQNAGGAVQQLPPVTVVTGRARLFLATIPLTGQAIGAAIGIARVPRGAAITGFSFNTTTSLGTATLSIGDAATPALFVTGVTLTTVNTPTLAINTLVVGQILNGQNYDSVTGLPSIAFEDVILTVGTAALPVGGTLKIVTSYAID